MLVKVMLHPHVTGCSFSKCQHIRILNTALNYLQELIKVSAKSINFNLQPIKIWLLGMLMCHMLYSYLSLFKHRSHPKFLSGFKYVGGWWQLYAHAAYCLEQEVVKQEGYFLSLFFLVLNWNLSLVLYCVLWFKRGQKWFAYFDISNISQ